ncbi:hypothetical protein BABINDRAFT_9521 [Babjeviella inositovora NRRL Y-12698]|uniref:Eukaryotic translation initiation factor 3 subunit C n=1 Tax=Babjeviella inositovora NRRL Y-12698 TaxID=984486 RepID=A0A1E3QMK0_9ASCO|nr:uncharacterized protein BABINDRAFT_9521 [Babjeviella inositovora NRRL Y-12698]ODQ78312.1 hypothetical protein BABINDRAFT_9521 [Babjeviella inositovora NRRL Y-12698]
MSRFFAAGYDSESGSSSEEDLLTSSSEEELSSSEEEQSLESDSEFDDADDSSEDDGPSALGPAYFLKKAFLKTDASDSDSDDEGRKVVKSSKEKLMDEMRDCIALIDAAKAAGDWVKIVADFDKLGRALTKAQQQSIATPAFYVEALAALDDAIAAQTDVKKMSASESRAYNTVRQRVKKQVREFQARVDAFRAGGDAEEAAPVVRAVAASSGIFATLQTIAETRGKKNVDRFQQIQELEDLAQLAKTPFEQISVYLMMIPIRFDVSANAAYMSLEQWMAAEADINALFDVLETNAATVALLETAEATDNLETEPLPNAAGVKEILGSAGGFVERLDDELARSLQSIDSHAAEYSDRLKDEARVYALLVRAQLYAEATARTSEQLARLVLRRLDHIYYKPVSLIAAAEAQAWSGIPEAQNSTVAPRVADADTLVDALCSLLYTQNSVFRKRAMLSHIYYYAKNNQYYKARDMFLLSHLQATIHTSEPQVQVLFNRALVQLGLCAFRAGLIAESQQVLQEIATSPRSKELLGQGTAKFSQTTTAADKQRLLPYHMHTNLELLEAAFMTGSMLLEIPQIAAQASDYKRKTASKSFRRSLEFYDRQYFTGPPENTRDHVLHAAKALQAGDWKKAHEFLCAIKIWNLFPDAEELKAMMRTKLQVEGLRTYVFTFRTLYSKLSIAHLAAVFELSSEEVCAVVSKMVFNDEIAATLSQQTDSIVFQGRELTKLQEMTLTLTEKIGQLSERNERLAAGGHQAQSAFQKGKNYTPAGDKSRRQVV